MSYLNDPRVFLATERTLLAWIRTEISILAVAFVLKKFTVTDTAVHQAELTWILGGLCLVTLCMSILAVIQTWSSLARLDPVEVPGPLAKPLVLTGGIVSILLCLGATYIVMFY